MTPFNQVLRLWLRRAPIAERAFGAVATIAVVGLLTWAAVPADYEAGEVATTAGPGATTAPGAVGGTTVPGATAAATPGAVAYPAGGASGAVPPGGATAAPGDPATGGQATGGPAAAAACPSGTDRGASETEIELAVSLIDVAGAAGNAAFGLPPADGQRAVYQAVVDGVNEAGGICGRQLVPSYYPVSPLDSSASHQACLEIVADEPFFVFDNGGVGPNEIPCFVQNQTPVILAATSGQAQSGYPYVFSTSADDLIYRNAVLAWAQQGLLDGGRIGVIFHDCFPGTVDALFAAIREAGVPDDRVSSFDFGPCTGFASPATHQQAVLQFRQEGVTTVIPGFLTTDFSNFTKVAAAQGFQPDYLIPDRSIIATAYGALAPDWNNIDGALAMTSQGFGEEHTPGFAPSADTQHCNQYMAAAGLPPVYEQEIGFGGIACNQVWMLQAMIEYAPAFSRTALAQGLNAAGSAPFSYPGGPSTFSQPGATWGGQFYRPIQASAACRCFTVVDPTFQPSFP
jgi:hypothetical protein